MRRRTIASSPAGGCTLSLQDLANELNLDLSSFIVVDDSPIECAEIRSRCPSVVVAELPAGKAS
jgi:predicted enzyme involved in methoxymalonyl-ACP biosynthesis